MITWRFLALLAQVVRGKRMPNPIDTHLGKKIREARILRGMSQSDVAQGLGMSFQQVQKYESGANRIAAGRLYEVSVLLNFPVEHFYAGFGDKIGASEQPLEPRAAQAARDLSRIRNPGKRDMIVSLIQEILRDQECTPHQQVQAMAN
ncbi:MAG: helix-turn-helix transcriptional regulator [Rhodobacteraceae bacterium]|nr:helix-turn-helix transcriptional regulator [Paracoccaceae bacterium]